MSSENIIGKPFVQLSEVDSTNNYAMAQVQVQMAGHGSTWFARTQNKGKGQRAKAWISNPGENIILTTIIEPQQLLLHHKFKLSAAIALSCHDFFSAYAGDETKIKWPNDVYWKDRKAGGILIENILHGSNWKFAIVGIGININQTTFPDTPNAVSLKQITGKTFDTIELAHKLCTHIEQRWQLLKQDNTNEIIKLYNQVLYKRDESVTLKKASAVFTAKVKHVNEHGELAVNTGVDTTIKFGEVEWVIK